uniref:Uncharacterized protein n=1 Tax=Helianthus annuus TaxID=4232 RepID=A0A251VR12_HELAN
MMLILQKISFFSYVIHNPIIKARTPWFLNALNIIFFGTNNMQFVSFDFRRI